MAFDKSPTQNRTIALVALATGVALAALSPVFDSYFHHMMEQEAHSKILPNTEVTELRAEAEKRLATSPVSLAKAKQDLETRGRESFADIQPKPSDDTRALVGWSKLPHPANDVPATTASQTGTQPAPGTSAVPSLSSAVPPNASASAIPAGKSPPSPQPSVIPTAVSPAPGGH